MRNLLLKTASTVGIHGCRSVTAQASPADPGVLKPWSAIPTPPSLPVIGQLHHYFPGGMLHNRKAMDHVLYKKYGPIVRLEGVLGIPEQLYLFDPGATAEILRGENWAPTRPGFFSLRYYRNNKGNTDTPTGLITEDGDKWKKFRNSVNPALMQPKTIKLYADGIAQIADDVVERFKSNRDSENKLTKKLSDEMSLWALESIGLVAFGRRLKCLDPHLPADSPEKQLIKLLHECFEQIFLLDFKPNLSMWIKTPAFRRAMKTYAEQERLTHFFINKSREELKMSNETRSEENKSVLEKLLDIDEEYAVATANDLLFAGVDTVSNAIIYALYLIAKNPETQKKLREEVMNVDNPDDRKYLKACIKETFRLYPLVPGNLRFTKKEYNILGYVVPKDIMVIMFHEFMCRQEEQYPRADEFIPERWMDKDSDLYYSSAHPFTYAPFGFGVRTCIGRRIAQLELETLLSKLIQQFQVEWFGAETLNIVQKTVYSVEPPYNFVFKDVK